ncbi:MAG: tRNA pseudouridine(38-40) synthase TruA [Peptostreptococcales bacterium]
MNVLLIVKYDGSNFSGWQRLSHRRTVQGDLERVLSKLCRQKIEIKGTGRTDAGVHAYMQAASFQGDFQIPLDRLKIAANKMLSDDLYIVDIREVDENFHARFDCIGKTYIYKILISKEKNVFSKNYFYNLKDNLNVDLMKEAAKSLIGEKDFRSFMSSGSDKVETIREIYKIDISEHPDQRLWDGQYQCQDKIIQIKVIGNGFLYNMVRIMVGTLVDVGSGKIDPDAMNKIIESKDRSFAKHTAPAQGLYLEKIYFDKRELEESIKT